MNINIAIVKLERIRYTILVSNDERAWMYSQHNGKGIKPRAYTRAARRYCHSSQQYQSNLQVVAWSTRQVP
jgi:hypothetical protein